jgi:hypothetical protein
MAATDITDIAAAVGDIASVKQGHEDYHTNGGEFGEFERGSQGRRDHAQFEARIIGGDHLGPVRHMKRDAIARSDAARRQSTRKPIGFGRKPLVGPLLCRQRRMPRFLAEFVPGASKHLLVSSSSVGLPLLRFCIQFGCVKILLAVLRQQRSVESLACGGVTVCLRNGRR